MHIVYLALGSNVGDRKKNIEKAVELLSGNLRDIKRANIYESIAVGYQEQDDFLNTVIAGTTELTPSELLIFIKSTERQLGRVNRARWGPREIDIDIIFYDNLVYKDAQLEIPHKLLQDRDFVLIPLSEIAPSLLHPVLKKTVAELRAAFPKEKKSVMAETGI